jgi:hypothetical protein
MDTFPQLLEQAANDNADALVFLKCYMDLGHKIDDIVDDPETPKEQVVQTFLLAVILFSANPFYQRYREQLYPLLVASLNSYATSVAWEKSDREHRRTMADSLRASGIQVVEFVALICGGIERMRILSPLLREDSWKTHHTNNGTPT